QGLVASSARNVVNPPVEENRLCMDKHQKRMDFFNIDILDMNSSVSTTEMKGQPSSSCPILLLKNRNIRGSCVGWSFILLLTWVKAFWVPLVNRGAHPVGLRENHWIACDVGLPSFPFDFPYCNAHSCFMAPEAIVNGEKMDLRPIAMRPSKVPSPPPWDSIKLAFETASWGKSRDKLELELDPERAGQIPLDRKLCFLRVLLRAYKEGAFEEGAVICAPRLTDILLWTSRSDVHEEQLQIPHIYVKYVDQMYEKNDIHAIEGYSPKYTPAAISG
ncbi:hypothetical protein IFM89_011430, partial [Coptis chinensis]